MEAELLVLFRAFCQPGTWAVYNEWDYGDSITCHFCTNSVGYYQQAHGAYNRDFYGKKMINPQYDATLSKLQNGTLTPDDFPHRDDCLVKQAYQHVKAATHVD